MATIEFVGLISPQRLEPSSIGRGHRGEKDDLNGISK
jgi:hypothetical protein